MKLKNILTSTLLCGIVCFNTGCVGPTGIDAGEEGVLIKKPWFLGHGGIENEPVETGLVWTAWSTSIKKVNIKPFNITEPFNDLITIDNNPVDFEIHMTFQYIPGKTPILIEKFGLPIIDQQLHSTDGWYGSKVQQPLRNSIREFTKAKTMFSMTTDPKSVIELENIIVTEINKYLANENIPVKLLTANVGKVNPPKAILEATIQTGIQKQSVKTQEERVKAEQAREIAEKASALADKAYMNAINMNPDQYLRMKELDNQKLAIEKGNQVNIIMGNAIPTFNIK